MLWSLLLPTVSSLMASQPAGFPHQEEGKVCAQVPAGCPPGPWCSRQMASAAQGRFQHPGTASSAAPSRELPGSPGCLRTCGLCGQLRSLHAAQRGLLGQARLYCVQPDTWWHNWYRSRRFGRVTTLKTSACKFYRTGGSNTVGSEKNKGRTRFAVCPHQHTSDIVFHSPGSTSEACLFSE